MGFCLCVQICVSLILYVTCAFSLPPTVCILALFCSDLFLFIYFRNLFISYEIGKKGVKI